MQVKLTLRIEDTLIKAAKEYSKKHDQSLSQLISNYFVSITSTPNNKKPEKLPPITRSLKGLLRNKKISKKDYLKFIEDKYK